MQQWFVNTYVMADTDISVKSNYQLIYPPGWYSNSSLFTSLVFQTLWRNWINFLHLFWKNFTLWLNNNPRSELLEFTVVSKTGTLDTKQVKSLDVSLRCVFKHVSKHVSAFFNFCGLAVFVEKDNMFLKVKLSSCWCIFKGILHGTYDGLIYCFMWLSKWTETIQRVIAQFKKINS